MPNSSNFSFTSGAANLTFNVAVITGACRSGKTSVGNLLATASNVEHADEPWLPMELPIMVDEGMIDATLGQDMFATCTSELFNEMVLLRCANFRPGDYSSIWNQKTHTEIFARLTRLTRHSDARQFAKENGSLLLYNLADTVPFCSFFTAVLPNCKIIHVVRKGLDVAAEVSAKHWLSDEQLSHPLNAQIYRKFEYKGREWHLPWWVAHSEEETFLNYSEFERCVYYWCVLVERGIDVLDRMAAEGCCLTIRFEDFVADPRRILNLATKYLALKQTPLTEQALGRVFAPKNTFAYSASDISEDLYRRLHNLYSHFDYEED